MTPYMEGIKFADLRPFWEITEMCTNVHCSQTKKQPFFSFKEVEVVKNRKKRSPIWIKVRVHPQMRQIHHRLVLKSQMFWETQRQKLRGTVTVLLQPECLLAPASLLGQPCIKEHQSWTALAKKSMLAHECSFHGDGRQGVEVMGLQPCPMTSFVLLTKPKISPSLTDYSLLH